MRKFLTLLLGVLLFSVQLLAQNRTVTGKVTDASGAPISGASVIIRGTTTGTVTGNDGSFSISVPANSRLIISAVGQTTQELAVGSQTNLNVTLQAGAQQAMQEVVVVGYGTQRRQDLTGSVAQVSGAKLRDQPIQTFEQGLSGRAVGVNINIPNGVLNNPPVIRIRGVNSISLSSFPLVVVDGIPVFTGNTGNTAANNVLGDINPADIESIEILKDASAAAIYGSRAGAGVLLITTKKGRQGRARVNYETWAGYTKAYNLIPVLNAQEFTDLKNEGLTNLGTPPNGTNVGFNTMKDASGNLVNTNWYDYVYRTGFAHNHVLNVSGANERTNYYFSVGYNRSEGMLRRNNLERITGTFNIDQTVSDWLKVGAKMNYSTNVSEGQNSGSFGGAFNIAGAGRLPLVLPPNVPAFNADGSYNINKSANAIGQGANLTAVPTYYNAAMIIDLNRFYSRNNRVLPSVYADIKLFRDLRFRSVYGLDYLMTENSDYRNAIHGDGVQFSGAAQATLQRYRRTNWQNILTYDTRFAETHSLNVLVGAEQQYTRSSGFGVDRRTQSDPFFTQPQAGFTSIVPSGDFIGENFLQSYFGRINYDYKKKYLLSFNARRDGYSAFAQKWGNFYGGSIGWNISEEDFWKSSSIANTVNSFRIRGSYGQVGNFQGIGDFVSLNTFGAGIYATQPTLFLNNVGNTQLSWEKSNKLDVGFVAGLFNNRLNLEVTYYKNDINDLILDEPQAPSRGIPGSSIATNVGSMTNKGLEFSLGGSIISKRDFSWNANFNITTQKNIVTALANNNADMLVSTAGSETVSIIRVGQSIGSFYLVETKGINPANGQRVVVQLIKDANGNVTGTQDVQYNHAAASNARWTKVSDGSSVRGASQAADGQVFGPALPKWFGGLDNTVRWKGVDLNFLLFFSGGNYVYNGTKAGLHDNRNWNNAKDALERWTKPGESAKWPKVVYGDNISNGSGLPISNNLEKGDFLKVRNITLGYSLPAALAQKAKLNNVRVYVAAFNALTFTSYSGFDPEIQTNGNSNGAPSVDRNSTPLSRTFNFGLQVGF
ncbi:MAG: SusC/RagA family TonB-linked outer membrane protein [Bacteroidota bacterium]|nr:SusC/RagA family TonB-linked outer membrane protein [Bacteroidota bacterium]